MSTKSTWPVNRRGFLRTALAGTAVAALPVEALAATAGPSPYGGLAVRDGSGLLLPSGFTARVVAESGQSVSGTSFVWRGAPDGAATFPDGSGGWFHAVNHELSSGGGVSVLHFDGSANVIDAYSILDNTRRNCGGGPTPWGTWLSCEEVSDGLVYECDPSQPSQGVSRPALGRFNHEAVAVDPIGERLFLTEDRSNGLLYRFTPTTYPDLTSGVLEVAFVDSQGNVSWTAIPDPSASTQSTRTQLSSSLVTRFNGGEGIWYQDSKVWFTTKGDDGVWEFDLVANRITRIWNGGSPLTGVDNITVEQGTQDIFVAEDGGNMEIVIIDNQGHVAPFLRVPNQGSSEITGPVFNPAGDRMYFSSQRGTNGNGITYEVTGPFRGTGATPPAPTPTPSTSRYVLQNVRYGNFLTEVSSNRIELTASTGVDSEWDLVAIGTNRFHLINVATGRWLDSDGGGNVVGTSSSPASDDEWELDDFDQGRYTLRNLSANRYLDADTDDRVRLWSDQQTDAQWRFLPAGLRLGGRFVLLNVRYGNYLSEVSSNRIELVSSVESRAVWQVIEIGTNRYHLVNTVTGRWLDSDGAGNVVGTSSSPGSDDEWELDELGIGEYSLRNFSANRYLDADTDDRVRLWSDQQTDARWRFLPVGLT
ncbi:MAG: alkaline phosphatase PhoX [Myxococcota bacterium]